MRQLVRSMALSALLLGNLSCRTEAQDVTRLTARPHQPSEGASPGLTRLSVAGGRETLLYIPAGYRADQPLPLLVLLHGATQNADLWTRSDEFVRLADEIGVVLLMPNSIGNSWDLMRGGYGPDVVRLDSSLAQVFRRVNIDRNPKHQSSTRTTRAPVWKLGGWCFSGAWSLELGIC
jgi:poly(3-hydroxybutyrate) depolymerase